MWPVKIRSAFLKFTNMIQLSNQINVACWFKYYCSHIIILKFKNIIIFNTKYKNYKDKGLHSPPCILYEFVQSSLVLVDCCVLQLIERDREWT